jgi:hypothetical protein
MSRMISIRWIEDFHLSFMLGTQQKAPDKYPGLAACLT